MINFFIVAMCMQPINQPQISRKTESRIITTLPSRHKSSRIAWSNAQATVYTVAENGRSTANNESCFSNGPEYLCAMPTNLNPGRKYCQHKQNKCKPIYVTTKSGEIIVVHVVDHCPHSSVIDFNAAAANKIFLNKTGSTPDWWSRSRVKWFRD